MTIRQGMKQLLEEDYESILYGGVMKSIEDAMSKNGEEIRCRSCELAREYDEEKWGVLKPGKYDKS